MIPTLIVMMNITPIKSCYLLFCLEKHAPYGKEERLSALNDVYALADSLLFRYLHQSSLLSSPPVGGDIPVCEELMMILRACQIEDPDCDRWSTLIIDLTTLLIMLDAFPCASAHAFAPVYYN